MSQSNETPSPEEEKRPFQFSLRTMFVVTFLWAVFCAIWSTFGLHMAFFAAGACTLVAGIILCNRNRERLGALTTSLGLLVMFLSCVLAPPITSDRAPHRRASCINKLKQIGLALHAYEEDYGSFPPAYIADESGKPMHSWRVLLLPYLDHNGIYEQYNFDEPWDGPNNSKLHCYNPSCYKCPSEGCDRIETNTCYVAVVGPKTMFPGEKSVRSNDIPDGTSSTIMVVEVSSSGIYWMEPRDLNIEEMSSTIDPTSEQGIRSDHWNGVAHVLFADGSVHSLSKGQLTPEQLQALLTRNGGEEVDDILDP